MSAINVFLKSRSAHVMTDGACCAANGALLSVGPKIFVVPHLNLVVAARGARTVAMIVSEIVSNLDASDFDEVQSLLPSRLVEKVKPAADYWDKQLPPFGSRFDLIVAGLSPAKGPAAFFVTTDPQKCQPMWEALPLGTVTLAPDVPHPISPSYRVVPNLGEDARSFAIDVEDFDASTHGLEIMERQRRTLFPHTAGVPPVRLVGGFAQETVVRPEGITTRVVRRWPSTVGQLLET